MAAVNICSGDSYCRGDSRNRVDSRRHACSHHRNRSRPPNRGCRPDTYRATVVCCCPCELVCRLFGVELFAAQSVELVSG